jgi:F-type H+-transporting ATPase subunit delta
VKEYIEKKFGAKEVRLKKIIDENIKGGIIIRARDEVMDGSIAGRVNELKKVLVK